MEGGIKIKMGEGGMVLGDGEENGDAGRGKKNDEEGGIRGKEKGYERLGLFDEDEVGEAEQLGEEIVRRWRGTEAGCRLQNLRWEGKLTDGDVKGFVGRWWAKVRERERSKEKGEGTDNQGKRYIVKGKAADIYSEGGG